MSDPTMTSAQQTLSRVVSTTPLGNADSRWISMVEIRWMDAYNKEQRYEGVLNKEEHGPVSVAYAAPYLHYPDGTVCTTMIKQHRLPIDKLTIELPGGYVDEGETVEQAAVRELYEETGYGSGVASDTTVVKSKQNWPIPKYKDPGLTNFNFQIVEMDITMEEGAEPPEPKLDIKNGEYCETEVVPLSMLSTVLDDYAYEWADPEKDRSQKEMDAQASRETGQTVRTYPSPSEAKYTVDIPLELFCSKMSV